MAIKTLGSAQKIRVGRESGNTTFIFLTLSFCRIKLRTASIADNRQVLYLYGLLMI